MKCINMLYFSSRKFANTYISLGPGDLVPATKEKYITNKDKVIGCQIFHNNSGLITWPNIQFT